jgi:hypothetical protein
VKRSRREATILLDIDGVLNPALRSRLDAVRPDPFLSCEKKALVRRLARCGRIAWVSIGPAEMTADLEDQLQLDVEPLRVTLLLRGADGDDPTPKLRSAARWLARMKAAGEAGWDSVVWIDDVLGPDARNGPTTPPAGPSGEVNTGPGTDRGARRRSRGVHRGWRGRVRSSGRLENGRCRATGARRRGTPPG